MFHGPKMVPLQGHVFYIGLYREKDETIFLSKTTRPRALIFGMKHHLVNLYHEYDQEIPQSQTADNPVAPRGRAAQPSRDTIKTN